MSNLKVRTAAEQCAEHVDKVRLLERRRAADRALIAHMTQMRQQYGSELTLSALVRYLGLVLLEGAHKPLVQISCRVLAKFIARSTVRRLLTKPPLRH